MRRRDFLASATTTALLSLPRPARSQDKRVLRFVPQANLTSLDPIWTTAAVTGLHGYYVFDTLFALDEKGDVQPQMAERFATSDDGRVWTIRLRDGLRWHDGEPVLARDCTASLERWSKRDTFGQSLARVVDEWGAADERTIQIKLKSPFPLLPAALGKISSATAFMMPERLAKTDPFQQVTEMVGSGPFRFIANEFVSGSHVAYGKFDQYVPRQEPASGLAGGKMVYFDRVEWTVIPDSATASAALQAGEVDWWDQVNPDLSPLLRRSPGVTVGVNDPAGYIGMGRFNALQPPFNNPAIRRAVLLAANQDDYLRAITGNDPDIFSECHSMWPCGTAYGEQDQPEWLRAAPNLDRARAMLKEAGYKNEKVVVINPSDLPSIGPFGQVTADLLKRLGMNVELVETDWGSVIQRRASKAPPDQGGWSMFHTWWPGGTIANPAINPTIRGQGEQGGWFGWYKSEQMEHLAADWLVAPNPKAQAALAEQMQQLAFQDAPILPLGRYFIRAAWRTGLTGFVKSSYNIPWNVRRA